MSAIQEEDSVLFVAACMALTRHPRDVLAILSKLAPVSKSGRLPCTTTTNLLRLLLSYVSAVSAPIGDIAAVSREICDTSAVPSDLDPNDLLADVQDLLSWIMTEYDVVLDEPQGAILQTAQDIVDSLMKSAEKLGFTVSASDNSADLLFSFIRAKTIELSSYYCDISTFQPFFDILKGNAHFESWYNGVVMPYQYYWQNYASLSESSNDSSATFLGMLSYWDQFDVLITPLQEELTFTDKLTTERYLANVILPFAVFHENNLLSLTNWMYYKHQSRKPTADFQLWDKSIRTVLGYVNYRGERFPESAYRGIFLDYLASCVYFGIYREDEVTPMEQTQVYDQILATIDTILSTLDIEGSPAEKTAKIDFENLPTYGLFADFRNSPENPFSFLFESLTDLHTLRQCIATCCELYPVSRLTMRKYLEMKASPKVAYGARQKGVVQILSQLSECNYSKVLASIDMFANAFVGDDTNERKEIDQLVIERLLNVNLLAYVPDFYRAKQGDFKMSPSTVFDLTLHKFWDLFDNASSLDDRIGKLKLADECVGIMNVLSEEGLDADRKDVVIRIRHLLNALKRLKNFRFVIERNQPVTPHQVVVKLKSASTYSPITLVSSVLEQNPKAYFAFEKLYKIASDLAIYLQLDITEDYLPRVQSACIESSLVDGNFDFAYKQSKDLFQYYTAKDQGEKLNQFWLTFYQVGKFILTDWLNDYDEQTEKKKIATLLKQREILSLTLKLAKPSTSTVDNSRLIISQLRHINQEINVWFAEDDSRRGENVQRAAKSTHAQLQENINGLLNEAALTAANSKNQASQKLSKMLVSGLGWALGAEKSDLQL